MTYSSSSPVVTTTSIILCFNKHRLTQVHLEMAVKMESITWFHLLLDKLLRLLHALNNFGIQICCTLFNALCSVTSQSHSVNSTTWHTPSPESHCLLQSMQQALELS